MKKLFLIVALLCSLYCLGQDSLQPERTSILTFSLGSPTFSYAPRYSIGYMRRVAPRWYAGLEAGYGNYGTAFGIAREGGSDFITKDYRLYEIRPEIYYSLSPRARVKHFVSAELFYINHTDRFITGRYDATDGLEYRYDAADYRRVKAGLNINYSLMFYFTERFGLLWKTGFGVARRDITFSNVLNKVAQPYNNGDDDEGDMFGTDVYREEEGAVTKFNFNLDLKLFYKF